MDCIMYMCVCVCVWCCVCVCVCVCVWCVCVCGVSVCGVCVCGVSVCVHDPTSCSEALTLAQLASCASIRPSRVSYSTLFLGVLAYGSAYTHRHTYVREHMHKKQTQSVGWTRGVCTCTTNRHKVWGEQEACVCTYIGTYVGTTCAVHTRQVSRYSGHTTLPT